MSNSIPHLWAAIFGGFIASALGVDVMVASVTTLALIAVGVVTGAWE